MSVRVALLVGWFANGGIMIYLLGVVRQYHGANSAAGKRLLMWIGIPTGLLVASGGLVIAGMPFAAAVIALGPLVVLGAAYGVFMTLVILSGRRARWN